MCSSFFKNCRTLFVICVLTTISIANAQEVRVIDNKGTIETIRNNNVYTSPTDPVTITTNEVVEGDVWFDNTDPNNIITKIYDGTNWLLVNTKVSLLQDADSDTKIQVEEGADDDTIRFDTVGTQRLVVTTGGNVGIGVNNPNRLLDVGADIFVNGISLGRGGGNISSNLSLGTSSLNANTLGGNNTGVGSSTLLVNSTGSFNTAVGQAALAFGANPEGNVAVGSNALIFASGQGNIAIGRRAGDGLTTGDFNIIIGNNIEVPSLTGDNQLNIGNAIYGNLATGNIGIGTTTPTQRLDVLGSARIDEFIFDENNESGTAGQILSTTATGIDWVNAPSTALIQDADTDTKIQVEEGTDDDTIRFDTAGTERAVISATGNVGIGTTAPTETLDVRGGAHLGVMPVFNTEGTVKIGRADNAAIRFHEIKARNGNSASTNWMQFNIHNAASTNSVSNVLTLRGDERVGISTTAPTNKLTINANIAHDNNFNYSTAQQTIFDPNTNGGNSPNGTRDILHLVREGIGSQAFGNKASFALGRYENAGILSRSQLDIKLTDGNFNAHNSIMSLRSNGNVGIGTTAPTQALQVIGNAEIGDAGEELFIGNVGHGNWAGIAHKNQANTNGYALIQNTNGRVLLNAPTGQTIGFRINNTERAVLETGGNFRVSNGNKRAVIGSIIGDGTSYLSAGLDRYGYGIAFSRPNGQLVNRISEINNNGNIYSSSLIYTARSNHIFTTNSSTEVMRIRENGRVGIRTPSPDQTLSVNGNASKAGGGSWATFSDKRVKDNIRNYDKGLNELLQINPVVFNYNELSGYEDTQKEYVGVIAQDIEKILPSTVTKFDDSENSGIEDKRQFDNSEILWLLVNAVKNQQKQIEALKIEIKNK